MNKRKYKDDFILATTSQITLMQNQVTSTAKSVYDDYADINDDRELCVCEYINRHNQRAHLVQCMCNCEHTDKLVTSLFCCECVKQTSPELVSFHSLESPRDSILENLSETWAEVIDRCRIPYPSGARKINSTYFLSLLYIFLFLFVGSVNLFCSVLVIFSLPTLSYVFFFWSRLSNRHSNLKYPFFVALNCYLALFVLFNFFLGEELTKINLTSFNISLWIIIVMHLYLQYSDPGKLTIESNKSKENKSVERYRNDGSSCKKCMLKRDDQAGHCPECARCVYRRDLHCFWLGNCIGHLNQTFYVAYLIMLVYFFCGLESILYRQLNVYECSVTKLWYSSEEKIQSGSQLSCLFDVYYANFARSFIFCAFLQLVPINFYFIMILLQKFIFLGMNMTNLDVHRMTQRNVRFSLLLYIANSFNFRRACQNWLSFVFKVRRRKDIFIYQQAQLNSPPITSAATFLNGQHLV